MLRRWYSNLSLRTKATSIGLAITTVSLAVIATTGILQIRYQIADEQRRSVDSLALGFARASELSLAVRDQKELSRLCGSFLRDENILFVAAYGKGSQPLATAVRDHRAWESYQRGGSDSSWFLVGQRNVDASTQADEFGSDPELDLFASPREETSKTSKAPPAVIGKVVVGVSTASTMLAQRKQSRLTVIMTLSTGTAGGMLLFVTLGGWMRRLQRLADASQTISRGDFTGSTGDTHDDEIGRLGRSFDDMRLALQERDLQLRNFTDTLQHQVKQRTKDLEQALGVAEEANRAKSLFLANMSHELRTPLNGVIGMVDLLLAAEPSAQQRRYCDVAKSSARSLLELINDILDFSKIEAGKLELDSTEFNLHEVIEGVTQMLGERAESKRLELACRIGPGVPKGVSGDPMRLRQVIMNLISNSIKFTQRGEVVLGAERLEETESSVVIRFSVSDTGIGIPRERLNRLFKSFSQVDASTTRKFGGTGLGLAISQRIVELMGGQIGVESEEGKGSTFWFTTRMEKRLLPQVVRRETPADPRGMRVLAVDDNNTNREILQAQLASWSLKADVAESGQHAIRMLHLAADAGEPYRFAILDMHMPEKDGVELAREIKSDPATKDVILISLSSIGDHVKPQEMSRMGFAACLTKPALPSSLYNAIVDSLSADVRTDVAAASVVEAAPSQNLRGVRVLLAEDNEINRLVASELLKQAGCDCAIAVNGREAVDAALGDTEYDVILMDCQMPELDGFEATGLIRQSEQATANGKHRPIIALTANAIKGDREKCLEAGMDGYVTKPIEPHELFKAIRSMLSPSQCAAIDSAPAVAIPSSTPVTVVTAGESVAAPIDWDALRQRCLGNRKLAAKALGKFGASIVADVAALVESAGRGDAKAVAASAHKLKGAAGNMSAEGVRRIASDLEQLAKADGLDQIQGRLEALRLEAERVSAYAVAALADLMNPAPGSDPQTSGNRPAGAP